MKPVICRSDMSSEQRFDVGMESYPGMRSFLPCMTWSEMTALRDELNRFLADSRNAGEVPASG